MGRKCLKDELSLESQQPSGKHRALLIGINYVSKKCELNGCHKDVAAFKKFLMSNGYQESDMRILMDDGVHINPDRDNILEGFSWLAGKAEEGDSLFFFYSGHGVVLPNKNGSEANGMDECLVSVNRQIIRDDLINRSIVRPLPKGAHLTSVCDCCHSASMLDLPYMFEASDAHLSAVDEGRMSYVAEVPGFFEFFDHAQEATAEAVSNLIGKDTYEFGDITRAVLRRFTHKDEYQFGDVTHEVLRRLFG